MKVLVTGAAGFIGFHVAQQLLQQNISVVGLDEMNAYYDLMLKRARLDLLQSYDHFTFTLQDVSDGDALFALFTQHQFTHVIHLAAQAGVRYSIEDPDAYLKSNLIGFHYILESCRRYDINHLVYASSGSTSGLNRILPSSVSHMTGHPMSLYAASKRSNELCAHAYSHLYNLPTTGLRFFSVYGPWGRPDMALFLFTEKILRGETIDVYNYGDMTRDWTHIDDIVQGILASLAYVATPDQNWNPAQPILETSSAPFKLYHLGRGKPASLTYAIELLEECLGKKADKHLMPMQLGDVKDTYAEIDAAQKDLNFDPQVDLEQGIPTFVQWYRQHYGL
jgi:UDP-glucuronate 4-epimerase